MSRPFPPQHRSLRRALLACALAAAAVLAGGCANPRELTTGSTGSRSLAPWQTQAAPSLEAVRLLTDGEGELVVASAIAAHEMRRP